MGTNETEGLSIFPNRNREQSGSRRMKQSRASVRNSWFHSLQKKMKPVTIVVRADTLLSSLFSCFKAVSVMTSVSASVPAPVSAAAPVPHATPVPESQRLEDLVLGSWYSLQPPTGGKKAHIMEYAGPLVVEGDSSKQAEYLFKDRHGHRWRYTPDYLVTGPVPRDELTPIELEIQRYRERGYPQDEDSAPGYLRAKDLVVGEWYQVENYDNHLSFKGKYMGPSEHSNSSYFVCKYGVTTVIPSDIIKPVDRKAHWYVSGPIPADTLTPAELHARNHAANTRA